MIQSKTTDWEIHRPKTSHKDCRHLGIQKMLGKVNQDRTGKDEASGRSEIQIPGLGQVILGEMGTSNTREWSGRGKKKIPASGQQDMLLHPSYAPSYREVQISLPRLGTAWLRGDPDTLVKEDHEAWVQENQEAGQLGDEATQLKLARQGLPEETSWPADCSEERFSDLHHLCLLQQTGDSGGASGDRGEGSDKDWLTPGPQPLEGPVWQQWARARPIQSRTQLNHRPFKGWSGPHPDLVEPLSQVHRLTSQGLHGLLDRLPARTPRPRRPPPPLKVAAVH